MECKKCNQPFAQRTTWQKFCCDYCRNAWHNDNRRIKPVVIIDNSANENNLSKHENKA